MKKTELRTLVREQVRKVLKEAFIGPFVFNNNTPDEELIAMYHGALDGYTNYKPGMHFKRAEYKLAYQAIEKLLKQKGVAIEESAIKEEIVNAPGQKQWPLTYKIVYDDLPAKLDLSTKALDKLFQGIPYQHLAWPQDSDDGAILFKSAQDLAKAKQKLGIKESTLKEAKEYSFTFDYNTDPDDIEYIENLLKKARVNAYAEKGAFDDEMVIKAGDAIELRKAKKTIEKDGFEINESVIKEDAGMVVDVAMGVAAGLMGLWALVQGAPAVQRLFGDAADYLADKAEKKAKSALKNQRKETIAPIIAKFKNDSKLADMYQALPAYDRIKGSSNERKKQLTSIGNYIKSKLTPEEMQYFRDVSAMLRTGDLN